MLQTKGNSKPGSVEVKLGPNVGRDLQNTPVKDQEDGNSAEQVTNEYPGSVNNDSRTLLQRVFKR